MGPLIRQTPSVLSSSPTLFFQSDSQCRSYGVSGQLAAVSEERLPSLQTLSEVVQRCAVRNSTFAAGSRPARASASW